MNTISVVLLVAFVIVCLLLILLVSVQDNGENGMGGLMGGRSTTAFGAHSGNVLTKTTFVLVIMFFALSLGLALTNKKPKLDKDLVPSTTVESSTETTTETTENWWTEGESSTVETLETTVGEPEAE